MLTDSQVVPPDAPAPTALQKEVANDQETSDDSLLSEKLERATRLFEIISAHSDIDQPICVECTELLVDGLQKRLASSTKERDMYVEMLRNFNADIPSEEEVQHARSELDKARARERSAMSELEKLEAEKAAMDEELLSLKMQSASLDARESTFWASRISFSQTLAAAQKARSAAARKHDNDAKALQRLQRANVYNDAFQISHDGSFGTINGLRLGRLPDKPVDWAEINAAWGHTLHLLGVVAAKLGYAFPNHRLVPLGSKSKIVAYAPPPAPQQKAVERVYELYSSGEFSTLAPLSGLLHRRFDASLVVFLGLLDAVIAHTVRTPMVGVDGRPLAPPAIPYAIERDRIGEVSIRLGGGGMMGGGGEESWTKACKNVLICCKYLLAQASLVGSVPAAQRPGR